MYCFSVRTFRELKPGCCGARQWRHQRSRAVSPPSRRCTATTNLAHSTPPLLLTVASNILVARHMHGKLSWAILGPYLLRFVRRSETDTTKSEERDEDQSADGRSKPR